MRMLASAVLGLALLMPGLANADQNFDRLDPKADSALKAVQSDRVLKIVNKTKSFLMELYTSPVDAEAWGADQLGNMRIAVGGNVTVNLQNAAGACEFDLMMVFSDGEKIIRRANVCQARTLTITEKQDEPLLAA